MLQFQALGISVAPGSCSNYWQLLLALLSQGDWEGLERYGHGALQIIPGMIKALKTRMHSDSDPRRGPWDARSRSGQALSQSWCPAAAH